MNGPRTGRPNQFHSGDANQTQYHEREYTRGCHGKIRYTSKKQARGALRVMAQQRRVVGAMNAYGCRFCHGWHLGH